MYFAQDEGSLRRGQPWWLQVQQKRHQLGSQGEYALARVPVWAIRWSAPTDARHKADGNAGQPSRFAAWTVRYPAIPFRVIQRSHQGVGYGGSEVFVRGQPDQ
jgi:hypothetical protein